MKILNTLSVQMYNLGKSATGKGQYKYNFVYHVGEVNNKTKIIMGRAQYESYLLIMGERGG